MLIGLSGYARVGKDEVAKYLVAEHGFTRIAFADALRDALYALNPIANVEGADAGSIDTLAELVDCFGWEHTKTSYPEVRRLLQVLGTEVGRQLFGDNVWVDIAMRKAAGHERVVFTDVRFPNEAAAIRQAGGRIWRIERPGFGPVNGHPSETAMDGWDFDLTVVNDTSIEHLHYLVGLVVPR